MGLMGRGPQRIPPNSVYLNNHVKNYDGIKQVRRRKDSALTFANSDQPGVLAHIAKRAPDHPAD